MALQVKVHIIGKRMVLYMMVTGKRARGMVLELSVNLMAEGDSKRNTLGDGKMT